MVSIGIITVVTAILLFRFDAFNSTTLLNSQAYEMALDIRQAQVSGVSVRGDNKTDQFNEEFGVYFRRGSDGQYLLYRDNGNDKVAKYNYDNRNDPNTRDDVIEKMYLDTRFRITEICANSVSVDCPNEYSLDELSIYFARPNFDAKFWGRNTSGVVSGINSVSIAIQPLDGGDAHKFVYITPAGQISVK